MNVNARIEKWDSRHLLLDAGLNDSEESGSSGADDAFRFRSLDAVLLSGLLFGGTASDPVTLYIAPGVYWLHDPERDISTLFRNDRGLPCEKIVRFDWLKIVGLSEDPARVVLAARKGQSFGCVGNYTMFSFEGRGLWVQNITLGNYCNVDLEYPWNPALSRPRRSGTITQAQLADFRGEKLWAENCRFVSRLNLMPISGAAQSVYRSCHFESTDDALNGHAVYEGCDFDFYGGCPFWGTAKTGVIFRECLFRIHTREWRFAKHGGQISCLECRFESAWDLPGQPHGTVNRELLIYELHNTWNGQPFSLGQLGLQAVPLDGLEQLAQAFLRWEEDCPVCLKIDEVPDCLSYEDGPLKLHAVVAAFSGRELPEEGVRFEVFPEADVRIRALSEEAVRFNAFPEADVRIEAVPEENVQIKALPEKPDSNTRGRNPSALPDLFALSPVSGQGCTLRNCNEGTEAVRIRVHACTDTGLRDEISLALIPRRRQAPEFQVSPSLQKGTIRRDETHLEGMHQEETYLKVECQLGIPVEQDNSLIVWYRISGNDSDTDKNFSREIATEIAGKAAPVVVARGRGADCARYLPDMDDVDHWLFAEVTPECRYGEAGMPRRTNAIKITAADIFSPGRKETDFRFLPLEHRSGKGLFLFDRFLPTPGEMPPEWRKRNAEPDAHTHAWGYGSLGGGCVGNGIYPMQQGSSVVYEPSRAAGQDMRAEILLDPAKTAGQGFGSAGQYLDILLRCDSGRRSGIGVRIMRTTHASDAVEFSLIRYSDGMAALLTAPETVSCFLTGCRISVEAKGGLLSAKISCDTSQSDAQKRKGRLHEACLSAELAQDHGVQGPDTSGANSFCLIHTGTCGDRGWMNSILLHRLEIRYF